MAIDPNPLTQDLALQAEAQAKTQEEQQKQSGGGLDGVEGIGDAAELALSFRRGSAIGPGNPPASAEPLTTTADASQAGEAVTAATEAGSIGDALSSVGDTLSSVGDALSFLDGLG